MREDQAAPRVDPTVRAETTRRVEVVARPPESVLLTGPEGRARGTVSRGIEAFEVDGRTVLESFSARGLSAASARVTPSTMTRDCTGLPSATERVTLAPDAPAILFEWRFGHQNEAGARMRLGWQVPGVTGWRVGRSHLAARLVGGRVARFLAPRATDWRVELSGSGDGPGATLQVSVAPGQSADASSSLLVFATAEGPSPRRRAKRALRHLRAQRVRAVAGPEERGLSELRIDGDETLLVRGLDWAASRMPPLTRSEGVASPGLVGRETRILQGLGAIALGRFDEATSVLRGTGPTIASLLARWRGDMASGQTEMGHDSLARFLRPDRELVALERASAMDHTLATRAWRAFDEQRLDDGIEAFSRLLAAGFAHSPGEWTVHGSPWPDPTLAALVPATLVFGMLGAQADAFFGRLRLAPRLPASSRSLTVANLRCGECLVELRYHGNGADHTFRLLQTGGAVPLNLIFEPAVPGSRLERVLVDGDEAELDRFVVGGWTGARLQLPLDRERSVALVGAT